MAINIAKEYNLLNECKYIRNKDRCLHDTNTGYEVFFNRELAGWDSYEGISVTYLQGSFLWGIVEEGVCYIGRSTDIEEAFEADYFGDFEVDMLINVDDTLTDVPDSFTARIAWKTASDSSWPEEAYIDLEVLPDGVWHRYHVNLLEHYLWVGDCNNFRFYPMIDGLSDVEVVIKRFAFRSDQNYKCKQPACARSRSYKHPCPFIGTHSRAYSLTRKSTVSIDDNNSKIGISIDNYPPKYIDIDLSHAHDPWSVAQSITMKLNAIGIGGYKFAECIYDPIEESFSIYSGTKGEDGSVAVYHGGSKDATEELGFFSNSSTPTWKFEVGENSADGYSPNYYKYPATILYRLPSATTTTIDYNPDDPLIELGRRDIIGLSTGTYFEEGQIKGLLMVDIFGKSDYEGNLGNIYYRGNLSDSGSRVLLLRPTSDTTYEVVYSETFSSDDKLNGIYIKTVDWSVRPGDVAGLYQCLPAVHSADSIQPEKLYKYSWIEKRILSLGVGDTFSFTQDDIRFYGYESLPVYGFSSEKMLDVGIEAELRYEYGVSNVVAIAEEDSDYLIINLTNMDSTTVTVSTTATEGTSQPAPSANYSLLDTEATVEEFWVDFMFSGIMKQVYRVISYFEEDVNLRNFCWEWYVEPKDRKGYTWGTQYPSVETYAPLLGSSEGWRRMLDPVQVIVNGAEDYSSDMYLGWNYVTEDASDYFPGLTEDEQKQRLAASNYAKWNQLDQAFPPLNTRGLRLFCWKAKDYTINGIQIYAYMENTNTLINSIEAYGISGPLVFDTEKYDVTNVLGDKYSSSNISRVQTEDYIYGMEFNLQESNIAVASVGTTLSKLDFNLGGLPTKLIQIKIIPQKLAVRLLGEGDEPVEEVTDLKWGMPIGQDWSYGPTKTYKVCNDRTAKSRLILSVADPLAVDQACVFYSKLDSYDSLTDPYRGLASQLIESPDYYFSNDKCINYRSIVYAIMPIHPSTWYSSTTSGAVWQTVMSGSPFSDTTLWSEPSNPYNSDWQIYNWAKASNVYVTSGSLNFAVESRVLDVDGTEWRNPTYFQAIDKSQYLLIEAQVNPNITTYQNVDASAGLVVFDNNNRNNFFKIERYTGNGITASGYEQYSVPLGDYVNFGYNENYSRIELDVNKVANLLFRVAIEQNRLEVGYRLPWDSWTSVSSYDITNWSNDIRAGLFTGAIDRTRDTSDCTVYASFDYVAYKKSSSRKTDFFDYECDFEDLESTVGGWTSHNAHSTEVLSSCPSGIHILKYLGSDSYVYFDPDLDSPALETSWGAPSDQGTILFNIAGYNETILSSGIYSAGVLLRDTNNYTNYIQVSLKQPDLLEIRRTGEIVETIEIDSVPTTSGIWFRFLKSSGVFVPTYSYDNVTFTTISGYRIADWSDNKYPVSIAFSTDLPEVEFRDLQIGTSQAGANKIAAGFDSNVYLLGTWGQQFTWDDIQYTSSGDMTGFSSSQNTGFKYICFSKDPTDKLNLEEVLFIPDPYMSKRYGYNCATYELDQATEMLFDKSGQLKLDTTASTASGGTWPSAGSSYKGIPQYDIPVLIIDLGRTFDFGRSPLAAANAYGKFSRSITQIVSNVEWESNLYPVSGFSRKCLLSSSDECTTDPAGDKPSMIYTTTSGGRMLKYHAGTCDGSSTIAGYCYTACPLFSLGNVRWVMLQNQDHISTAVSGGSIWFFAPIEAHPKSRPNNLTDFQPWWSTDYGNTFSITEDGERALIYSYPGLNIEGSCYFNPHGSEYWRLTSDKNWTYEDGFSIDLKLWKPQNINSLVVRVGRDPKCFFEFTVTGTLTNYWSTHSWFYKDAQRVIRSDQALTELCYTFNDEEYYTVAELAYGPYPFANLGYVEIVASGVGESDIYIKNMKNTRTRFTDNGLYLGLNEGLYIPEIDLMNAGTIEFDYYPSEAAINLTEGDPRDFVYNVMTISNNLACISVVLHPYWGWNMYCHTPDEKYLAGFLPVYSEATRMLPSLNNKGPFHLVLSWDPDCLPNRTDNIVLWVDGGEACSESMNTLKNYFVLGNMKLTLGKGAKAFDINEVDLIPAAYATFANLKVYKYAVPSPSADLDTEAIIPENLIELSLDNENWASFTNCNLPLVSSGVDYGECVTFYMRNKIPSKDIKSLYQRFTAYLSVMWEVTQ